MSREKLLARGAEIVNGHVFLNRKLVGIHVGNDFIVTPDGEAELAVEDVPFVEAPAEPVAAPAKPKKAKAAVVDETANLLDGLDQLGE